MFTELAKILYTGTHLYFLHC